MVNNCQLKHLGANRKHANTSICVQKGVSLNLVAEWINSNFNESIQPGVTDSPILSIIMIIIMYFLAINLPAATTAVLVLVVQSCEIWEWKHVPSPSPALIPTHFCCSPLFLCFPVFHTQLVCLLFLSHSNTFLPLAAQVTRGKIQNSCSDVCNEVMHK